MQAASAAALESRPGTDRLDNAAARRPAQATLRLTRDIPGKYLGDSSSSVAAAV